MSLIFQMFFQYPTTEGKDNTDTSRLTFQKFFVTEQKKPQVKINHSDFTCGMFYKYLY